MLGQLDEVGRMKYVSPYLKAIIHLGLGEREAALGLLERLYEESDDWLVWLNVSPEMDSLRDEPRFLDLLRQVGF